MIPSIQKFPEEIAKALVGIFFDIDDTFTLRGKIPDIAFKALWDLKKSHVRAVPITGRPAGWCDHIARMWPVDGIVGENGAFYFWYDEKARKLKKRFLDSAEVRVEKQKRLMDLSREILASIPGTVLASDQRYREADLAVDYCEDVPSLNQKGIEQICEVFKRHGAKCKVSSVHVNGWFGEYDKLHMTKIFVHERWGLDLDSEKGRFLFCGDSPNDEPMFRYFPYTAGVRNVLHFAGQMSHLPVFLAGHEGGQGFAEIVQTILEHRSN